MELDRVALDLPSVGVPGSCSEGPADSGSLGGSSTSSYHCGVAGDACAAGYPAVELVLDNPRGGVPSELQRWATDSDPWEVRAPARTIAELAGNTYAAGDSAVELVLDNPRGEVSGECSAGWRTRVPGRAGFHPGLRGLLRLRWSRWNSTGSRSTFPAWGFPGAAVKGRQTRVPWEVRAPARTIAEWPETLVQPAIPLSSWCSTIPGAGSLASCSAGRQTRTPGRFEHQLVPLRS